MTTHAKTFEAQAGRVPLRLVVMRLGPDAALVLTGGDRPHVGAVVCAEARPSLRGEGASATSSVINRIGHKDEVPARRMAEAVAAATASAVSCTCGIHVDGAQAADIEAVLRACVELTQRAVEFLVEGR